MDEGLRQQLDHVTEQVRLIEEVYAPMLCAEDLAHQIATTLESLER